MELSQWLCWYFNTRICSNNIGEITTYPQSITSIFSTCSCTHSVCNKNTPQYATAPKTFSSLDLKETKYIQSVTGSLLYYGRALDHPIIPALNEITSKQSKHTQKTKVKSQRLIDYVHTYPNSYIRYYASNMILNIDSNVAYLVTSKARSRVVGYYHLSSDHQITKKLVSTDQ